MFFNGKTIWRFQRKKNASSLHQTNKWNTRPLNATIDAGPCNQEEVNGRKIEKIIQIKAVGNVQLELRSQVLTCSTFM